MSSDYTMSLLIADRIAGLQHEADQERLARLAREGQARKTRWWERLMLFRHGSGAARVQVFDQPEADRPVAPRPAAAQPAAPVAAGATPC